MKLELAAFRELAAFAQFATDLDRTTRAQLERGLRSQEVLKQPQFQPFSLAKEVTIIYALTNGFLDDVADRQGAARGKPSSTASWRRRTRRSCETIAKDKALSDETIYGAARRRSRSSRRHVVV